MFDHERMEVYRAALPFIAQADAIVEAFPPARRYLKLQLQRSAASVAQNIGEGAGEYSAPEKARFYRIALRSATECAASLDIAIVLQAAQPTSVTAAKHSLKEIVSMLVGLCRYLEGKGGEGRGRGRGRGRGKGPPRR